MSKRLIDEATVKLVLEVLETSPMSRKNKDAIDVLREALAEQPAPVQEMTAIERHERNLQKFLAEQPAQQEPVAVTYKEVWEAMNTLYAGDLKQVQIAIEMGSRKLYTTPQPAQREFVPWSQALEGVWAEPDDTSPQPAQRKPLSKPLTQTQVVEGFCEQPHDVQFVSVFNAGVRIVEHHHDIKENT